MKCAKKQIEALVWHNMNGIPEPHKVRYELDGSTIILKTKTIKYEKKLLPDNTLYIFYNCQIINGQPDKCISIEYDMGTGKWYLN